MIKLTLREVVDVSEALAKLPRLPIKASFNLARIRDKIRPELLAYIEQERALIEQHGGKIQSDGRSITWPAPKDGEPPPHVAYLKDQRELQSHEIQIDREPVSLELILGSDPERQPQIEPEVLSVLEKIIVE